MRKGIRQGLFLLVLGVGAMGWFSLQAGTFLAVSPDVPAAADLLVVLGGGNEERIEKGAEIWRSGLVHHVLLTGVPEDADGPVVSDPRYAYLKAQGLAPPVLLSDSTARSTWQEAQLVRKLLEERGWRHVLVVSDPPHLRRLHWVYARVFRDSNRDYRLVPTEPRWWKPSEWWSNRTSRRFVITEYVKYVYYRIAFI
jgi:uncharacterized SAM-binding protein YcdF (DUF218 family)